MPLGSQASKTVKGGLVTINHGMRDGSGRVMFAKDMLSDENKVAGIWDTVRAAMFGPSALDEYNCYWISRDSLTSKETEIYDALTEAGVGYEEAFRVLKGVGKVRAEAKAKEENQKKAIFDRIDSSVFKDEFKGILYYNYIATQTERDAMTALEENGIDPDSEYRIFRDIHNAEKDEDKLALLEESPITENQKALVFYDMFASERERELYTELTGEGAEPGKVYRLLNSSGAADKATSIRESSLSKDQKEKVFYRFIYEDWENEVAEVKAAGGDIDMFAAAYSATRGIVGDKDKNGKTVYLSKSKKMKAAIDKAVPKVSRKAKEALYAAFGVSEKVW